MLHDIRNLLVLTAINKKTHYADGRLQKQHIYYKYK